MRTQVMSIIKHCRQILKASHTDSKLSHILDRIAQCGYLENHLCLTNVVRLRKLQLAHYHPLNGGDVACSTGARQGMRSQSSDQAAI